MKKFQFSLEKVLHYKAQVEDNLRMEQGLIEAELRREEGKLHAFEQEQRDALAQMDAEKRGGCALNLLMVLENHVEVMRRRIALQNVVIAEVQERLEQKRAQVIQAKTERSSIGKLREKKLDEYQKQASKDQELLVEEFITTTRRIHGKPG